MPEERLRQAASITLRSPNSRVRSKMKARWLILEADSSTESRAAMTSGRPTLEAGAEVNMVREKEASAEKGRQTSEVRRTPIVPSRAPRKEKGKAIMTEEVPPRRDEVSSAGIRMKTPLKRTAKVFAVSSDTKEDPTALEKIIESAVEDVSGEACEPQKVKSPRTSAGTVILETGKDPTAEEAQSQVFSAADVLCGQVLPLL